jgi:hypothetical protein
MKTSLAFWRGRIAANRTMADNTGLIADQSKTGLVALNLGAAHTRGVADRFSEQERPFAVVRPASLDTPGLGIDLDLESLEGIEQRASLFSEGLISDLQRIYPVDAKNSEPACNLPWVQAELELFFFARRIAGQAFSGPGSTLKTNVAARLGFRSDQFRGRRVEVDPGQMEIVPDTSPESARVLLLRARLKSLKGSNDTVFWVKTGVVPQRSPAPSSVETVLVQCLDAIRRGPKPGRKIEDARGRVLITDSILAAFALTKEAALKVPVSEK